MPDRDKYLPPDILMRPPQMGDQNKIRPVSFAASEPTLCDFCGDNLAWLQSAGLVVEYNGMKFCSPTCLESWIDKQAVRNG